MKARINLGMEGVKLSALHNGTMKSGKERCNVQSVARLISVGTGSKKVDRITFARNADGSFLTPILRLLATRMRLSESASNCTSMAQDFERLNGSRGFIIRPQLQTLPNQAMRILISSTLIMGTSPWRSPSVDAATIPSLSF
jgi:hypothetical protein